MRHVFRVDPKNPAHCEVPMRAARFALQCADGGEAMDIVVQPVAKSRDQEMMYHALIGEFARGYTYHGQELDPDIWKRLLVDAFKRDTRQDPDLRAYWDGFGELRHVPCLNGSGFVTVGEQTRRFPKKLAAAFITWLEALQAECSAENASSPIQPIDKEDSEWE